MHHYFKGEIAMTFWEILELQETTDVRKIRHAYAQLSKECHPETEPERFQKLYQAYQEALAFAKGKRAMLPKESDDQKAVSGHTAGYETENAYTDSPMFEGFGQRSEEAEHTSPEQPEQEVQIPDYIKNISGQSTAAVDAGLEAFRQTFEAKGRKDWKKFMTRPEFLRVQFDEGFVTALSDYLMHQNVYPVEKLPFDLVKELVFAYHPFMEEHMNRGVLFEDDGFNVFRFVLSSNERFDAVAKRHDAPQAYNEVVKYWAYYGIYSSIKKTGAVQDGGNWNRYLMEIAGRSFYLKDGVKTPVDKLFYPMFEFLIREGPVFSDELYGYLIKRFSLADAKHSSRWQDLGGIYRAIEEKGVVIEGETKAQEKQRNEIRFIMDEIEKLYCLEGECSREKIREFFRSEVYGRHKLDGALLNDKLLLFSCLEKRLFSKVFTEEYLRFYDEVYGETQEDTGDYVYSKMQYYHNTDLKIGEGFSEITENRQEWVIKYFFEEGFTRAWPSHTKGGMQAIYRELLTAQLNAFVGQRHYERDLYKDGHLYALRKADGYLFVYDNMRYEQYGEKAALTAREYYHIMEKLMDFYLQQYTCMESIKEEWSSLMKKADELCDCTGRIPFRMNWKNLMRKAGEIFGCNRD